MAKLRNTVHLDKRVGIIEFGLLVTGIFKFDDFHKYTNEDSKYCLVELYLSKYIKEVFTKYKGPTTSKYLSDFQRDLHLFNQQGINKRYLAEGIFQRLDALSQEEKKTIKNFIALIENQARTSPHKFPCSIRNSSSQTDSKKAVFALNDLCIWVNDYIVIEDTPIANWFKEYQKNHRANESNAEYSTTDGHVKIDTLPKIMQFMIECHSEPTYQHSHINNRGKSVKKFKSDTVENIIELSVKKGLEGIKNLKPTKGLNKTQVEYIFDFIQKK